MSYSAQCDALVAQGIQFTVLARAFPVLRHDALKPISNAKLAAAMMQRNSEDAVEHTGERSQQLLADIDSMLDEGVDTVRQFADWLSDSKKSLPVGTLLRDCAKLLFTELLLSGKKVVVREEGQCPHVPLFGARYVTLCWLLYLVEQAPDGSELSISCMADTCLKAVLRPGAGSAVIRLSDAAQSNTVTLEACKALASHYGWRLESGERQWTMHLPDAG